MLTKKSNFEKGIFNRNAEEKKAMHNEIQSINSIIDAPPPRVYLKSKKNINIKQACKDKLKMPGIIQMIPFFLKTFILGSVFPKTTFPVL